MTGGLYEETDFHATGSGGKDARNTLKRLFRSAEDIDRDSAVRIAIEALADAAEEDVGTAGPDPVHSIYPTVFTIDLEGVREVPQSEVEVVAQSVLDERRDAFRRRAGTTRPVQGDHRET